MRILYIGHYTPGCTTYMRGEHLKIILKPTLFAVADIDIVHAKVNSMVKSLGWRFKKGPLIKQINQLIRKIIEQHKNFDIVWVDKGVFIEPAILVQLKQAGAKLIHYTPDTAFFHNRSNLFYKALAVYDHCITTKSFEIDHYKKRGAKNVLFCTQGYDPTLHKPYHLSEEKSGVVFIGLNEPSREEMISALLQAGVSVKLAGARWKRFVKKQSNPLLSYYGRGLFGEAYARLISESQIGLGLLSKKFPEMHTTRTFEIPACGTLLATEANNEVKTFYADTDALIFTNKDTLVSGILQMLNDTQQLKQRTANGLQKVVTGGYDYESILRNLLKQMQVL
jgi:spore maturation protein CgeB